MKTCVQNFNFNANNSRLVYSKYNDAISYNIIMFRVIKTGTTKHSPQEKLRRVFVLEDGVPRVVQQSLLLLLLALDVALVKLAVSLLSRLDASSPELFVAFVHILRMVVIGIFIVKTSFCA